VSVPGAPVGLAVTPDGRFVYVVVSFLGTVCVIDTATNMVVKTIPVELTPLGIAVNPDGSFVYVTNGVSGTVSVIDTSSNTVIDTVTVGTLPQGIDVSHDGKFAYVANQSSGTVSVIDTSTNTVVGTPIAVGNTPIALGKFIQPPPPPINTPTLSEWGLITMAGLLGIVGFMVIRRRKGTA
jgi:YVTN family beta-propeller protein